MDAVEELHVGHYSELLEVNTFPLVALMPVTLSIEQVVGCAGNDATLHIAGPDLGNAAVIKFVPLIVSGTARKRSIMSEAHITVMVGHGIAIIDESVLISVGAFSTVLALDQVGQIETLKREVDMRVNFLAVATSTVHTEETRLTTGLLEALQVHDENGRRLKDLHLLGSAYMILALVAVPFVVFVEHLGLAELLEAVHEIDSTIFVVA